MKTYAFNALSSAVLAEIVTIRHEPAEPAFSDDLARHEIAEAERTALRIFTDKLLQYKSHRVNEATIWARAIYPLLMLAERGSSAPGRSSRSPPPSATSSCTARPTGRSR